MSCCIRNFPAVSDVNIGGTTVPVCDDRLAVWHLVSNVYRSAQCHPRALRHIRGMITEDTGHFTHPFTHRLHQLPHSWLCQHQSRILQSIHNSVVRLVLTDYWHHPAGHLLSQLHWLPVQSRISFKIACLTYTILATSQPICMRALLHHYTPHCSLRSVNQHNTLSTLAFPLH